MRSGARWISVQECAEILSMSASGVRKKLDRGELPSVHVGRMVRVDLKALTEQLEAQIKNQDHGR